MKSPEYTAGARSGHGTGRPDTRFFLLTCILLIGAHGSLLWAGQDSREQIRERMKERFARLAQLKTQQTIGETFQGYVEVVPEKKAGEEIRQLVSEENADRRELYTLIAKETGTTPEAVGRVNGRRVFEKAAPHEYFRDKNGLWRRRKDMTQEMDGETSGK